MALLSRTLSASLASPRAASHLPQQLSRRSLAGASSVANPLKALKAGRHVPACVPKTAPSRPCVPRASLSTPGVRTMAVTALDEMSTTGAFVRTPSSFRNTITADGSSGFPAVANRYHLYISYACPWASRCYAILMLKGLEDVIGLTIVKPKWERTNPGKDEHMGWAFATSLGEEPDSDPDPLIGAKFVRDLYEMADPNAKKFSVPVLWDKETNTIVNNESADIIRMLNTEFNQLAKKPEVDIYPEALRPKIDEANEWIYPSINNGVYRCGFATKQEPYEEAFKELFAALDKAEDILSKQRYIAGDVFTEADLRLFVTLIRFDEVYVVHFKTNKKFIREYPNLFNYTKDVYQIPGIAPTVNMYHIKKHYFGSHPSINPSGVIPLGLPIDYSTPHDRDRFTKA